MAARTGAELGARAPYLTLEELGPLVRPAPAHTAAVHAWLRQLGAWDVSSTVHGEFVTASVSARALQAALGEELRVFEHPRSGRRIVRAARPEAVLTLPQVTPQVNVNGDDLGDWGGGGPSERCTY